MENHGLEVVERDATHPISTNTGKRPSMKKKPCKDKICTKPALTTGGN